MFGFRVSDAGSEKDVFSGGSGRMSIRSGGLYGVGHTPKSLFFRFLSQPGQCSFGGLVLTELKEFSKRPFSIVIKYVGM